MENTTVESTVVEAAVETKGFFSKALDNARTFAGSRNGQIVGGTCAVIGVGLLGYAGYRAYKNHKAKKENEPSAADRVRAAAEQLKSNE